MSKSSPKRKLTKAGVALSAEARHRLQQLADWIEREVQSNQDPRVCLGHSGGIINSNGVTLMSPMGALVQMFKPLTLADAKTSLLYGFHAAQYKDIADRAAEILGLSFDEYLQLLRYIYAPGHSFEFAAIAKTLRTLK